MSAALEKVLGRFAWPDVDIAVIDVAIATALAEAQTEAGKLRPVSAWECRLRQLVRAPKGRRQKRARKAPAVRPDADTLDTRGWLADVAEAHRLLGEIAPPPTTTEEARRQYAWGCRHDPLWEESKRVRCLICFCLNLPADHPTVMRRLPELCQELVDCTAMSEGLS